MKKKLNKKEREEKRGQLLVLCDFWKTQEGRGGDHAKEAKGKLEQIRKELAELGY